jgi:UDP-N-acetyl-D-glucosamine/UDP-N-acetyl-D-galactosamine dehydrogenase
MSQRNIAVVGLGYVGLPVAVAFAKQHPVIAFDIQEARIQALKQFQDDTGEISREELNNKNLHFTCDANALSEADFIIIAVPTPITDAHQPDLQPILNASKTIAPYLKKSAIVVYESTVYPGVTEEKCAPILEQYSGLICGQDFFLGYSPERINPGDKAHTFTQITKIVAGQNDIVRDQIADVYRTVVTAGIYQAPSIKVAEAAKVIENSQRDLNIAFVNELALICHRLGIDTLEVLEAAGTKWNFLPFKPGLVGGHCIGVDPYYLTYKAAELGLHPQVILAGRRVNDGMGKYIGEQVAKKLAQAGIVLKQAKVGILGLTFKENCADVRNTKVIDIVQELTEYGVQILVHDPLADPAIAMGEYGINLCAFEALIDLDAIVLAVAHDAFKKIACADLLKLLNPQSKMVFDIKGSLDALACQTLGISLWRL